MNALIKTETVQAVIETPTKGESFQLSPEVTVKVSDSRKCISIYGIQRTPVNFTIEQWDMFVPLIEKLTAYFENNRHMLLSQEERKLENQLAKQAAREERKQKERLVSAVDTATLATVLAALKASGAVK